LADFLNDPVNKAFHGSVRYNIYDALVTWRLPWFTINSTTSYFEFTNTGGQAISPTINIPQVFAQHTFEQELRLNSNSQGPFTWVAGALYENITGNEFQYLASIGAPFNLADKIPEKEINLYAQGTLALFDRRLEFTAGISYFSSKFTDIGDLKPAVATPLINSQDTDEFAPKASIAWHPNGRTTLYATYAKGLRAGLAQPAFETFVLRLADPTATGRVMSEIDNSYEVGAKGDFMGGRLHLEGDLFYIDISGPQETAALVIPGVGIPVNTIINAGKARSYGGEWMVAVQPVRGLTASVSGSYANATIAQDFFAPAVGGGTSNLILFRKGDPLDLVPKLTLNGSLVWTHQWGEFEGSASLTGQYSSTRYFTVLSRPPIPGDRIFRLDARYEIGKGPWRVFVFGDNLTNEKGVVGVSVLNNLLPHVGTIGTRLRPRTFGAGLKISY
jgi:iron complex outermembrane receptor protein